MKGITYMSAFLICSVLCACTKQDTSVSDPLPEEEVAFISAMDISSYPEIEGDGGVFLDSNGMEHDFLQLLQKNGINTLRLKLWVNPNEVHSSLAEVHRLSERAKALGFDIWLALHYSDTWADPGQQQTPKAWEGLPYSVLKDSVYNYTRKVMDAIQPDFIQIGNEINSGILHPEGTTTNMPQFKGLLQSGIDAVRATNSNCKIVLHFAGIENSEWFFGELAALDYDVIGLSYYPIWHGKSIAQLENTITNLSTQFNKDILIAETAYPFTLDWNDFTNNIVGLDEHLILPDYPATPEGQAALLSRIKMLCLRSERTIGYAYWGGELIAWKGPQATDASPWENQALFDFSGKATPAFSVMNSNHTQ